MTRRPSILTLALAFLTLPSAGCMAFGATQLVSGATFAGTTAAQVASSAHESQPTMDGDKADRAQRCTQLLNSPPGVEEVEQDASGAIESREFRLDTSNGHPVWAVYRARGSSPDGWHSQRKLFGLHFNPPLEAGVPAGKPRYLVYAVNIAEDQQDAEKMISVAEDFAPQVGTFQWDGRIYNYTLVKELPCFPTVE